VIKIGEFLGFHSGEIEDSGILGYDAALLGKWSPLF
jgi:hypothetical protein